MRNATTQQPLQTGIVTKEQLNFPVAKWPHHSSEEVCFHWQTCHKARRKQHWKNLMLFGTDWQESSSGERQSQETMNYLPLTTIPRVCPWPRTEAGASSSPFPHSLWGLSLRCRLARGCNHFTEAELCWRFDSLCQLFLLGALNHSWLIQLKASLQQSAWMFYAAWVHCTVECGIFAKYCTFCQKLSASSGRMETNKQDVGENY